MNPKALFITLLLAGCVVLALKGAWDFGNGLVEMRKERIRLKQMSAEGFEVEGNEGAIRKKIYLGAAMGFIGAWGLFIYISKATRKNTNHSVNSKTNKST